MARYDWVTGKLRRLSTAIVIDGAQVAKSIRSEISQTRLQHGVSPGLATVMVGHHQPSRRYVKIKSNTALSVGFSSFIRMLPETVAEQEVIDSINELNDDSRVHGIIVQLPLPKHLNQSTILQAVAVHKDVDGFNCSNVGSLALGHNQEFRPWENRKSLASSGSNIESLEDVRPPKDSRIISCAAQGCITLLDRYLIPIAGKIAVILGRSSIVGMPVSLLLMHRGATIINIGRDTPQDSIPGLCRMADILVSAVGIPEMVRGDWVKPGATVLDVGINYITKNGVAQCVGDVQFDEVRKVAKYISPVPGGIGPMCVVELLRNTLHNAISLSNKDTVVAVQKHASQKPQSMELR